MKKPRIPPLALAGKIKILGDIISPIVDEEDWDFEFPFVRAREITAAESQELKSSDRSNIVKAEFTSKIDGC